MPRLTFPTLNLLLSLVECGHSCPIQVAHAVWFGVEGDVVGHFYLPTHKGADPKLHFSAVWPPSSKETRERGEDALTLRRSHRRRVFEALAQNQQLQLSSSTMADQSLSRGASPSTNPSSSRVLGERKPLDIVAVLVLPPSATCQASVDYLDVTRLQQYCELPPPADGESQESILIAFPSTVCDGVRMTTLYLSACSDGQQSRCVVAEMRQSTASLSLAAVPLVDRTTTVVNLPLSRGLKQRIEPLASSLASSFSPEAWRSHRDRLSVMCMVLYRGSPKYIEKLWFLCALDAPSGDAAEGATSRGGGGGGGSVNMAEEISWSFHSIGRSRKAEQSHLHSPHRWTFTSEPKRGALKAEKREGSTSPNGPSRGSATATGGADPSWPNTTLTRQYSSNARSLVGTPGEFLVENSGRYVDDATAATQIEGRSERGCWQRYERQSYDVAESSALSLRRSPEAAGQGGGGSRTLASVPQPDEPLAVVMEQKDYVERLCDGSLGGYLVEPMVPIGRDRQAVSRLEAVRRAAAASSGNSAQEEDDGNGFGSADDTHGTQAALANHSDRAAAQTSCASAVLLTRLSAKEKRERAPIRTADPFVRVRNGLLLPKHKRQQTSAQQLDDSPSRHRGHGVSAELLSVMHRSSFMDRFLDEALREAPDAADVSDAGSTQTASMSSSQTHRRLLQPVSLSVQFQALQQNMSPLIRSTLIPVATPPLASTSATRSAFATSAEPLTPRTWLLEELYLHECRQRTEDACYEIYSIHGAQSMEQLVGSKAPHLRLVPQSTISLPFGRPMNATLALELAYWLSPFRHTKRLHVRCHEMVEVQASPDGEEPVLTSHSAPQESTVNISSCRFVVSAEFPNSLAAVKLDFSALAVQLDAVEAYIAGHASEQDLRALVAQKKALAASRQKFFQQVADTFEPGKDVTQQFLDAVSKRHLANATLVVERMGNDFPK